MRFARAAWLAVAVINPGCAGTGYSVDKDLSYDPSSTVYGFYDAYQPVGDDDRTDRPALIAIHGGGWMSGDKSWGAEVARVFCPRGYVVLAPNYRLTVGPHGAPWPAQIDDLQAALRHFRERAAALRIDPERIAAIGVSAGGNLATMLALRDDPRGPDGRVSVAIDLDGEQDMTQPGNTVMSHFDEIMTPALGHARPWSADELRDISPVYFARPDVALLAVHGSGDTNVYVANADWIANAVRARGGHVDTHILQGSAGRCHESCWKQADVLDSVDIFLEQQLTRPALLCASCR